MSHSAATNTYRPAWRGFCSRLRLGVYTGQCWSPPESHASQRTPLQPPPTALFALCVSPELRSRSMEGQKSMFMSLTIS